MKFFDRFFSSNKTEKSENKKDAKGKKRGKSSKSGSKPDFSNVDSLEKAKQLEKEGILEKVLLLPKELNGKDVKENVVYVPVGISEAMQSITNIIVGCLEGGMTLTKLEIKPLYNGNSFVPSSIVVIADNDEHKEILNSEVEIW